MATEKYSTVGIYKRALRQVRSYWWHLSAIFFLGLLSTPIALLTPLPLKIAVDSVIGSHPLPDFLAVLVPNYPDISRSFLLGIALGLLIVVALFAQLLNHGTWLFKDYIGEKITLATRSLLFQHAQRISLAYHDLQGVADSSYRIQWSAPGIRWLAIDGFIPLVTSVVTLLAMIYVTAQINSSLALVAVAISPILIILHRLYGRRLRGQWREVHNKESSALSVIQEALNAIRVVKVFGQEGREYERFRDEYAPYISRRARVLVDQSSFNIILGLSTTIGTVLVLYIGTRAVLAGDLTLGSLLLVMAYLAQMFAPLQTIGSQIAAQQASLASVERIFSLLDEPSDVVEKPDADVLERASGKVEFRNVSFAYAEGLPVLHNVSFTLSEGTSVGLVGKTGVGKTTLISLLMRLYDPTEGTILIDDKDIRDYRLADLRYQFAVVLQEPVLFSTSIRENIAYAVPSASEGQIVAAAHAANAHDFISKLPQGYDTVVGERGMRLSGGERQRVALARAFLKNAPVLILDEPTSSVDLKTESTIINTMERLMKGRTTFMIAHRLSTLEGCDTRLELKDGSANVIQELTNTAVGAA